MSKLERKLNTILKFLPLILLMVCFIYTTANYFRANATDFNSIALIKTTLTNFSDTYFQIVENTFSNDFYIWLHTNIFPNVTSDTLILFKVILIIFSYQCFYYFIKLLYTFVVFIFETIDNVISYFFKKGGEK